MQVLSKSTNQQAVCVRVPEYVLLCSVSTAMGDGWVMDVFLDLFEKQRKFITEDGTKRIQ